MQFYKINICQVMIFRLRIVYNMYEMIKIGSQFIETSQVFANILIILLLTVNENLHKTFSNKETCTKKKK